MWIDGISDGIRSLDRQAMAAARQRQSILTKPAGSLGRLEELSISLAGIYREPVPKIGRKVIIVAAGDHGVTEEGVSAYPSEVTGQMVLNFLRGGAAINVLARHVNADVVVVDAGVKAKLPQNDKLRSLWIGPGTKNMDRGPAMTRPQALGCLEEGIRLATERTEYGASL